MIEFLDPINVKVKKLLNRLTEARANNLDNCNSPISDCAQTDDPRFNLLNRLDVLLSSRLAAADYVASPIKSIQTGSFTFTAGASGTITLSQSINPVKSMLVISQTFGFIENSSYTYIAAAVSCWMTITNGSTLSYGARGKIYGSDHLYSGTVKWQVIEFN